MKTVGIIAEFNPFHNGHEYLINKAKKITGADNVVIICSGNYVQRGAPAVFDKSYRASAAISGGADAVFELPCYYSTASAELFARASVKFLIDLNCIDYICFGCESNNLKMLPVIASVLSKEPEEYKKYLNEFLKSGISFPKARLQAIVKYCNYNCFFNEYNITMMMSQPNNILAIEYLKALFHFKSNIKPVAVKRSGAGYNSLDTDTDFASATGIRNELLQNKNIDKYIPFSSRNILKNTRPLFYEDFSSVLGHNLLKSNVFEEYHGISQDLSNRIKNYVSKYTEPETFISELQSKNFTYSGISRALLHILLSIKKCDVEEFIENEYFAFARLLGFNKNSSILTLIKEKSELEIVSKLSSYYNSCSPLAKKMIDISVHADNIYRMIYMTKYKEHVPNEFERQIVIK